METITKCTRKYVDSSDLKLTKKQVFTRLLEKLNHPRVKSRLNRANRWDELRIQVIPQWSDRFGKIHVFGIVTTGAAAGFALIQRAGSLAAKRRFLPCDAPAWMRSGAANRV